jgi:predicted TIM-barrel fold metal-dependent hydrolase
MKNGYKVWDMDTHVGPRNEVLYKYMDPSDRERVEEKLAPYRREAIGPQQDRPDGTPAGTGRGLRFPTIALTRFPGTKLLPEHQQVTDQGSVTFVKEVSEAGLQGHHRKAVARGAEQENSVGRLEDMDEEGRDLDFMFGNTNQAIMLTEDPTISEPFYRAYHRFMKDYSSADPDRLKSHALVPANDVEWAISELKSLAGEKWLAAVRLMIPEDLAVDDESLEPLWATMNDLDLPLIHHSSFSSYPWFPGYRDIWGNAAVARTAAHPWGAARLLSYLIVGGIFDRYPNLRAATAECGQGWLPHWVLRLGEMIFYVSGVTPKLEYKPIEYVQMGRFRCCAEPFEGPEMTKHCIDFLGDNALMHQSDYPHAESHFPDTAGMVIDWPIWKELGEKTLRSHMSGNAEKYLRII